MAETSNGVVIVSAEEFEEAMADSLGYCRACGADAAGVEPDVRAYKCQCCGAYAVYGGEELLLMGKLRVLEDGDGD